MKVKLNDIRIDGGTQPRAEMNQFTIDSYAECMKNGDTFPEMEVYFDGSNYWLADGFHRYKAYLKNETNEVECNVHEGSLRDAVLFSLGVNARHGLPRTHEDKRKTVRTMLYDREWKNWSDREIARHCGVSHEFVRKQRENTYKSIATVNIDSGDTNIDNNCKYYTNKYGDTVIMNTSNIGKAATEQKDNIEDDYEEKYIEEDNEEENYKKNK